ncbi:FhaA domain-containing protein [Longivirga aurantiaca]|uniref:FhaA domain-containing protein n=1 Tax=Longivirga aurantiaca TaxID=1837743 RepID=A0ABW1T5R6_9ACTN
MGLLDRFEQRLDRMVNGAFARAFKAEVQPVEIASALTREMDDRAAVVSRGRTVVPNVFVVDLSPHDHDRLSVYAGTLTEELGTMVREHAEEQRYTFLGGTEITLARDDSLETGLFRVHSEAKAGVASAPNPARTPSIPGSRPDAGHPRLVGDDVDHPLSRAVTRIGRGSDVDIRVDDPGVSRHHAEILLGREVVLRDLGSTNGTYVDGVQVGEVVLRDGATVQLGSVRLTFRAG